MGWNGSGVFSRTNGTQTGTDTWQDNEAATGNIESDQHDTHDQDLADGIQACLAKNGENAATANIPMGGFKLTGLGAGSAAGNSVRWEQSAPGVMTTLGDTLYASAANTASRLPATADVAAHATTSNLWGAREIILTGAVVTFTDIADAPYVGAVTWVKQNDAHVWTDGAVFSVQGDANYTARAGDWVRIYATTVATFEITIFRADGTVIGRPGAVIQSICTQYKTASGNSAAIPYDDTIPQSGEGVEMMTAVITPKSTANKIRVRFSGPFSGDATLFAVAALFRDSVADALAAGQAYIASANAAQIISLEFEEAAPSTSAITYKIRVGPGANTLYWNGDSTGRKFGGVAVCSLTVEEVKG